MKGLSKSLFDLTFRCSLHIFIGKYFKLFSRCHNLKKKKAYLNLDDKRHKKSPNKQQKICSSYFNKQKIIIPQALSLSLSLSLICFSNLEIIFYMTSYTNDVFVNRPYEYQTIPLYNLFFLHVDDA